MKKLKGTDHPTLWDLLKTLREEEMVARLDIKNAAIGNPRVLTSRLKEWCRQYDEGDIFINRQG